ncbi:hypothetical protein HDR63_00935 [bacterium]|nr:hypothetical protein [bacterium]
MSYLWNEFNIKTFRAETIVYRNGAFCPELSTLPAPDIQAAFDLPIHIIYVGEIAGPKSLKINIPFPDQRVFLTVKIKNKKPAFLNILIKNTGKNSEIHGGVLWENEASGTIDVAATHGAPNTTIFVQTKLIAGPNTQSKLSGTAIIEPDCPDCASDISFHALAADSAQIECRPAQRIQSAPAKADHAASLYHPRAPQIQYLRTAGLSTAEINDVLRQAFADDFAPHYPEK